MLLIGSRGISGNARFPTLRALAALLVALGAVASLLLTASVVRAAPPGVVASFTYSPTLPLASQTVVFTSTSMATGTNNQIATQAWDLDGDGLFDDATGPTAARAFPAAGTFSVSLFVTDTRGDPASVTQSVTVNAAPSASFAYSSPATVGSLVYFFSTSSDPDGFIRSQAWDLDNDGQFDDGTDTFASRSFDSPGRYTVRLRVVDNRGASRDASADIIVGELGSPAMIGAAGSLATGLRLLSPFPIVRVSGVVTRAGIRVRLLTVNAPAGAKIRIRCRTRGCPFRRRSRTIESRVVAIGRARVSRLIRFNRFRGRLLRPGTVVQVFVTKPGTIGKYTRLRVRRGRLPARADRCLVPGAARPVPCPSS